MARVYSFAGFELDSRARQLVRGGEPVPLTEQQVDVLLQLLVHAGEVVPKGALIDAVWRDVAVTDNSLEQAISAIRKALRDSKGAARLIDTVPRRGYRLRGPVTVADTRASDAELAAFLAPHQAVVEGRAALESLDREAIGRARQAFEAALATAAGHPSAHLGLAHACILQFEATRADEAPDAAILALAGEHAREACRLDPQSGDAWAALALVLHHGRHGTQAIAAARRAVLLEADNWRHHFRLAYVAWGEERLRAADRTLALFPGFASAHWLAATVYVARHAFDLAARTLAEGAAAQESQRGAHAFASVGCSWLLGLVRLACGDEAAALEAFQRELAFEPSGQLHARECMANTWYAIGALHLRQGHRQDAALAFANALERVPAHLLAMIGRSLVADAAERTVLQGAIDRRLRQLADAGLSVDAAIGRAALATAAGDPVRVARGLDEALAAAPGGSAGWQIAVDPLLRVSVHEPAFASVLARLRSRAA